MKKRILTMLMCIITAATICIVFSSCGSEKTCENGGTTHKWSTWETVAATCGEAGSKTRECELCGETQENESYANNHPATGNHTVNDSGKCSDCGTKVYDCDNEKHWWGKWTKVAATCTEDGMRIRTCKLCDETEEDEDYDAPSAFGTHSYINYVCAVCGAVDPNKPDCTTGGSNHSWKHSYTKTTCTEAGTDTKTCTLCGQEEEDITYKQQHPATGHDWSDELVGVLEVTKTCANCNETQVCSYTNIAAQATLTIEDGSLYGGASTAGLVDGKWVGDKDNGESKNDGMAFRGSSGTFLFTFDAYMQIDQIAIGLSNSGAYKVYVITENDDDWTLIGGGAASGSRKEDSTVFTLSDTIGEGVKVLKVKIEQTSGSDGLAYWTEIAIGQKGTTWRTVS